MTLIMELEAVDPAGMHSTVAPSNNGTAVKTTVDTVGVVETSVADPLMSSDISGREKPGESVAGNVNGSVAIDWPEFDVIVQVRTSGGGS